jgi:hypothetical protein
MHLAHTHTLLLHHRPCSRPRIAVQQHRVLNASVASNEYHGPPSGRPTNHPLANGSTSAPVSGHAITVKLEKLPICANSASKRCNRTRRPTRLGTFLHCWPTSSNCTAYANCPASRPAKFEAKRGASRTRMKRRLSRSTAHWEKQMMA